jgi:hypothetical protein
VKDLTAPTDEARRDRWGRYVVVPPGKAKPVGYTRATTVAKALDDNANLMDWACRMTALGLAQRPDLLSLVMVADPTDRKALNKVCERAKEAGGATARRDLGTALHAMIERSHAEPDWPVPAEYAADVAALNTALHDAGYDVLAGLSEVMVVLDRHQIAGTADLVVQRRSDGARLIADIKTGSSVQFGQLAWAVQLAIYAHADCRYVQGAAADGSEDQRLALPEIDREQALILHVEPGSGRCDVYALDIAAGAEALEVAMQVRQWRKAKKLLTQIEGGGTVGPVDSPTAAATPVTPRTVEPSPQSAPVQGKAGGGTLSSPPPAEPVHVATVLDAVMHQARVAWVLNRIEAVKAHGAAAPTMAKLWPADVPRPKEIPGGPGNWSAAQVDAIAGVLDTVEASHDLAFGDEDPADAAQRAAEVQRRATLDAERNDRTPAAAEDVSWLRQVLAQMTEREREWVMKWVAEGDRAKHSWRLGADDTPTPRRHERIAAAALELAQLVGDALDDDGARLALAVVIGEEALKPVHPVGALLGTLTIAEAGQLEELCRGHRLADDGGTAVLVAVA